MPTNPFPESPSFPELLPWEKNSSKKIPPKVVLAYSGGLDTSVIVHWLSSRGIEVIALCLDLGQGVEDLDAIREKGLKAGASKVIIEDVQETFVNEHVIPALQWNALYEGCYLLGTALARPLIAKRQVHWAQKEGAGYVCHGATGKGNDQVRFELGYHALDPSLQVIAPWKIPQFFTAYPGRRELIAYAEKYGIPVAATLERPWSSDENLMHISFEAGMLEDPWQAPRSDMFELSIDPQQAPDKPEEVLLAFEKGIPVGINGQPIKGAALLRALNEMAGKHGIGRVDMVESRYVGMKSRGVYETPGATVLHIANRAMESITLDRGVINLKDTLMPRFSGLVYDGYWFSAETQCLLALLQHTQQAVSGEVRLQLYKGHCMVSGRRSEWSLYDEKVVSMEDDRGAYQPQDAEGFIRLHALPLKALHRQAARMRKQSDATKNNPASEE